MSKKDSLFPNPVGKTDKIDDYNTQFGATFTESQMYCLYKNATAKFPDKLATRYEFYTFLENDKDYKELFTCNTLLTPLPEIDFLHEIIVLGFTNKCKNVDGIKQYLVNDENQNLTINVVTKGQAGGGMGIGFLTKIKRMDKKNIRVVFSYNCK